MQNEALKLVLFDWDGTLVDSLGTIADAMDRAFASHGLPGPGRAGMREVVGLRLDEIIRLLHPDGTPEKQAAIVESYRGEFNTAMDDPSLPEELFAGVREGLAGLEEDGFLLGIATGKSLPGLKRALARYDIERHFVTLQTPDHSPGKPHPGMVLRALDELGVDAARTFVVGDTVFDMQMAANAATSPIGVAWGNHDPGELRDSGAVTILERFTDLRSYLKG